jgi:hypothetical protein
MTEAYTKGIQNRAVKMNKDELRRHERKQRKGNSKLNKECKEKRR